MKKYQFTFVSKDNRKCLADLCVSNFENEFQVKGSIYDYDSGKQICDYSGKMEIPQNIMHLVNFESIAKQSLAKNELLRAGDIEKIPESCQHKFVFTFGSSEQFPFHLGEYIIIEARHEKEAKDMFKMLYPNPHDKDTLNCAFVYDYDEFMELKKKYGDFKETPERIHVTDVYKVASYLIQVYELLDKAQDTMALQCDEKAMNDIGEIMGDIDNLYDDFQVSLQEHHSDREEEDLEQDR